MSELVPHTAAAATQAIIPASDAYSDIITTYTIEDSDPYDAAMVEASRSCILESTSTSTARAKEYNKMPLSRSADVDVLVLNCSKFSDATRGTPDSLTYYCRFIRVRRAAKALDGTVCSNDPTVLELPPNVYLAWRAAHSTGALLSVQYVMRKFDENARRYRLAYAAALKSKNLDDIRQQQAQLNTIIPEMETANLTPAVRAQYLPQCTHANVLTYSPNSPNYKADPKAKTVYAPPPIGNLDQMVKEALAQSLVADTVASLLFATAQYSQVDKLRAGDMFSVRPEDSTNLEECNMGIMRLAELECSIGITPALMFPTQQQKEKPDAHIELPHSVSKNYRYKMHIVQHHIDPRVWEHYVMKARLFTQRLPSLDELDPLKPHGDNVRLLVVPHFAANRLHRLPDGIEFHFDILPSQKPDDPNVFCTAEGNGKKSRMCSRIKLAGSQWQKPIKEDVPGSSKKRIFIDRTQHLAVNIELWSNHLLNFGLHDVDDVAVWKKLAPLFLYNATMVIDGTIDASRSLQFSSRKHMLETPYTEGQQEFINEHRDDEYMAQHPSEGVVLLCEALEEITEAVSIALRKASIFANLAVAINTVTYDAHDIVRRSGFPVSKKVASLILAKMPANMRPKGSSGKLLYGVRVLASDKAIADINENEYEIVAVNTQTKDREFEVLLNATVHDTEYLLNPALKSKDPYNVEQHLKTNKANPKLAKVSCFDDMSNTYLFAIKKRSLQMLEQEITTILEYLQPATSATAAVAIEAGPTTTVTASEVPTNGTEPDEESSTDFAGVVLADLPETEHDTPPYFSENTMHVEEPAPKPKEVHKRGKRSRDKPSSEAAPKSKRRKLAAAAADSDDIEDDDASLL